MQGIAHMGARQPLIITGSFCLLLEAHGGEVSHLSKVTQQVSNMAEIRFQVILMNDSEEKRRGAGGTPWRQMGNLRERERRRRNQKTKGSLSLMEETRGEAISFLPATGGGQAIARMGDYGDGRGETWLLSGFGDQSPLCCLQRILSIT